MKLTFKDLKQQKFVIEAEPSETISAVKEKISAEKGWDPALQKLIYSGKILQDANTVESYSIEEKGFIVCMVSKPKAAPTSSASTSKAPSTPAKAVESTPAPPAAPSQSSAPSSAIPQTPTPAGSGASAPTDTPAPSSNDPSVLTMGTQRAEAIANLESMGFERGQIEVAMRAAFFNPDRAVEYLLNGIPENLQQEQRAAAPVAQNPTSPIPAAPTGGEGGDEPVNLFEAAAQAGAGGRGASGGRGGSNLFGGPGGAAAAAAAAAVGANASAGTGAGGAGGLGNLDWLRNNPQFQQLRQVVQQQPQMLEPILQSVGAGNPQLAQLIGQHPGEFLQLLSEVAGDEDAPLPPGAQAIQVTEEERDAIERLCRLGFDREQAIQAYFACDKNEELAANFLFDQPDEEEGAN